MNQQDEKGLKDRFEILRKKAIEINKAKMESALPRITIGMATCGIASGAIETKQAFEQALKEKNIDAQIYTVGCIGHCYAEPVVVIKTAEFPPILYHQVTPGKARMLTGSFLVDGDPLFEHVLGAMEENDLIPWVMDFPRFSQEKKVITELCGVIDPEDINSYIANGGYDAFVKALGMSPEDIVEEIKKSGLRGRGGAGFSTGVKWSLAFESLSEEKIVICNADEGDPGAYMDRTILESNPHQVIEGIAICAYALGAQRAIVYVRADGFRSH
jgi:NADH-quinone oxidoreductase subunit F